ncbi:YigZ family protein [Mycoplasma iguanae]|uniref:YigZ family protein n=1 Tax=Mycoplasma iguanae TaxID=292461 RepID=A0ABY5R8N0_9MOLU|nr:YigZ family protein [Mycoplasma iguanae]UVD81859.1 YigZ family protein [Mycoplasma iguanae]
MHLYEIKKSKFYTAIYQVNSKKTIDEIIQKLKKEHKKARHICYAFYYQDGEGNFHGGYWDDGEPKGSAGQPLFSLLQHHHQINKLLVVIRYFGGTKLGYGGLLRAYINAAKLNF